MTDRDTFAAAALTGMLANEGEGPSLSATCRYAYCIADAMLAARTPPAKPSGVSEAYATAQQISDAHDFVRDREEFEKWKKSSSNAATAAVSTIDVEELLKELSDVSSNVCFEDDVRATCRDAAAAIERLRAWVNELQMSAEEREAIRVAVDAYHGRQPYRIKGVIQKFLERNK